MEIDVYWTDFAKAELKNIFDYYNEKVSLRIAQQIVTKIAKRAENLGNFPEIGTVEELLNERPQNFRYIVSTNYKIIYWVNKDKNRIEIVDVFDTRQNPKKIKRNK